MSALNYDIAERVAVRSVKGQTDKMQLTLVDAAGAPVSLAGNTFSMTIHASETASASATVSGTIASNVVTFSLASANATLSVGEYIYRVVRTYPSTDALRLLTGKYKLVL
jgi:uncharacterized membrane protein